MKQFNFKQMTVLAMFALTAISAQAQSTPEAIIGQCPDLPSVATLAASPDNQAAQAAKEAFFAKIAALRESGKKASERVSNAAGTAARNDAERVAQQQTGRSVAELQNMSAAEAEAMGRQLAHRLFWQLPFAHCGCMRPCRLPKLSNWQRWEW